MLKYALPQFPNHPTALLDFDSTHQIHLHSVSHFVEVGLGCETTFHYPSMNKLESMNNVICNFGYYTLKSYTEL